jgi:hypothetical protein
MTYTLSPHDVAATMSPHLAASHPARHFSRSYSSQTGSHTYRVEKPRSNHNSPRTVERRKTTTGAKLYATLDDHYNMMMGLTGDEAVVEDRPEPASTRPMSWHPSSAQFHVPRSSFEQHEPQDYSHHYSESSRNSVHGSDFYSMSARNSMYLEPAQNQSNYPSSHESHRGSQDSDGSWPMQAPTSSSYSTPTTEPMPWYLQEWARRNQEQAQQASTDYLPIQHPTPDQNEDVEDEEMQDSGKELVGMGLYDLPDTSMQWGSLQGEATGKGLKLEETWQPPEEEDEEDDDEDGEGEDDGDDASSEDAEEELTPPSPAQPAPAQLQAPVNMKPQTPSSMEGQSFFFEEDDNITKEWWYPQLRQPSLPVRDAGIGYGWL